MAHSAASLLGFVDRTGGVCSRSVLYDHADRVAQTVARRVQATGQRAFSGAVRGPGRAAHQLVVADFRMWSNLLTVYALVGGVAREVADVVVDPGEVGRGRVFVVVEGLVASFNTAGVAAGLGVAGGLERLAAIGTVEGSDGHK